MNASFRGGMQVHAVPEDERALDARGQPLPWAYAYADSTLNRKQPPVEKGPFGKPVFRQTTVGRQRTATPAPKPDSAKKTQEAALDNFFNDWKKGVEEKESKVSRDQQKTTTGASILPVARSTMDLTQALSSSLPASGPPMFKEPTEVLVYGFGDDFQYAAIDFYESISGGRIYEDYDRHPPHPRYNTFLSTSKPGPPRNLPPAAIRKINTYNGGDHWIKVTFESPEAAERACSRSPHIIHGYACYAELWRGVGPNVDEAIAANSMNTSDVDPLRQRRSSNQTRNWSSMPSRMHSAPSFTSGPQTQDYELSATSSTVSSATAIGSGSDAQALQTIPEGESSEVPPTPRTTSLRIRGATRAKLLPASSALLPVAPWSQRTFGHLPLVGSLVGGDPRQRPVETIGGGGFIGNVVPRDGEGKFDWDRASWYWRVCWWMDQWTGTDLLGMKGPD